MKSTLPETGWSTVEVRTLRLLRSYLSTYGFINDRTYINLGLVSLEPAQFWYFHKINIRLHKGIIKQHLFAM